MDSTRYLAAAALATLTFVASLAAQGADLAASLTIDQVTVYPNTAAAPTVRNLDGKEGVYLWKLPGTPKKTESTRHYYSVRYPSDRLLAPAEAGR